jgi:TRAP-type C4-dicarboxylate transport system permease small subunit
MSTSLTHQTGNETATRPRVKLPMLAIEAALVINVVILTLARLANGEFPVANTGSDDQTVGYVAVISVTLLVGFIAWGLLEVLKRTTSSAQTAWTAIAVAVFLVSLLGPLSGVDTASKVVLALLHIGAAIAIIPLMRAYAAPRN